MNKTEEAALRHAAVFGAMVVEQVSPELCLELETHLAVMKSRVEGAIDSYSRFGRAGTGMMGRSCLEYTQDSVLVPLYKRIHELETHLASACDE